MKIATPLCNKMDDLIQLLKCHKTDEFVILIDSSQRDKAVFPLSSHYSIPISVPYKHVIAMGILDASIPRTMYNIDTHNNTLVVLHQGETHTITLTPQMYTPITLTQSLCEQLFIHTIIAVYNDTTNTMTFRSDTQDHFAIDVDNSTMRDILGLYTTDSVIFSNNDCEIIPSGVLCLQTGEPCVCVVCDEISHRRSLSPGLGPVFFDAAIRNKLPMTTCPPIARLSRVTLSLERIGGGAYNTRGANHVIALTIRCMTPQMDMTSFESILFPEYSSDFKKYIHNTTAKAIASEPVKMPSTEENFFNRYQL